MDFIYLNKPWTKGKVNSLVFGTSILDPETGDGYRDLRTSWYWLRCAARDLGRTELLHDCMQLESMVKRIKDPADRTALFMKMMQWSYPRIGAAVGGRLTGRQRVQRGLDVVYSQLVVLYGMPEEDWEAEDVDSLLGLG